MGERGRQVMTAAVDNAIPRSDEMRAREADPMLTSGMSLNRRVAARGLGGDTRADLTGTRQWSHQCEGMSSFLLGLGGVVVGFLLKASWDLLTEARTNARQDLL